MLCLCFIGVVQYLVYCTSSVTGVVLSAIAVHHGWRSVVVRAVLSQSLAGGAKPARVPTLERNPSAVIFGEHYITAVAILFVSS